MKYTAQHILNGTLDEVLTIAQDRERDVRVYPNITAITEKKRVETDTELIVEYETRGDGEIPPALQRLITPKMVSWIEYGRFNKKTNIYEYKVKTFYFTNVFSMTGKITYTPQGDKVKRFLEGEIKINIPILGELAVKTIVKLQIENLDKEAKIFDLDLAELRKKNAQ